MSYSYQKQLIEIWNKAVELYKDGQRGADSYFSETELSFLKSIGHTAQEVYDFAEDFNTSQEPDLATFLMLADRRRSYFLNKQNGKHSTNIVESDTLPAKDESVNGIKWLPRIIPKAYAKLRGEMNPDLMYGCGGDRKFFKTHDIHPAEFLSIAETYEDDPSKIIEVFSAREATVKDA